MVKPIIKYISILTVMFFVILFATSKSLAKNKDASIEWFRDAGFGLFIHWGPVSQIGKEISWPLVGASKEFRDKYFSLYKTFNPTKFNPKEWARLAKQAGMRYVVFTTQHFNGFNMFDTALSNYNIMNTPYGKDVSAQLAKAFRDEGIAIGWYYGVENWHYYYETGAPEINGRYNSTQDLKKFKKPYGTQNLTLLEYELGQMKELLTKYGDIDVMWYDHSAKSAEPLKKRVWELNPDIVVIRSEIPTPEQRIPKAPIKEAWETCMTMGGQWAYKPNDNYKSAVALIDNLVKIRAGGGNYLLNIGPKPNGELPAPQVELLKKLGSWNAINGEAIHGVRAWITTNEDNIWFTKKRDANILYAIALEWPGKQLTIKSLRDTKVLSVKMLGLNKEMKWQQSKEGLVIETSDERPSKYAYTFKIEYEYLD